MFAVNGSMRTNPAHWWNDTGPMDITFNNSSRDLNEPFAVRYLIMFSARLAFKPAMWLHDIENEMLLQLAEIQQQQRWNQFYRRSVTLAVFKSTPTKLAHSITTSFSDSVSSFSLTSCWYMPTPKCLASTLTNSASGSLKRRAIETENWINLINFPQHQLRHVMRYQRWSNSHPNRGIHFWPLHCTSKSMHHIR